MYTREEYINKIDNNRIKIIDLIKYCIKKWKLLIGIFLVIFFICMVFIIKGAQKEPAVSQPAEMEDLTEEQKEKIVTVLNLYEELDRNSAYRNESSYMKLNAYDCNIMVLQYLIMPEKSSDSSKLYEIYTNFVKNGGLKKILEDELSEQIKRPSELVTLIEQTISGDFTVSNQYVISIKVTASNEEEMNKITGVVKSALENYRQDMVLGIEDHNLKLMSEDSYTGIDYDVKENQERITKNGESIRQQILTLEALLSEEEKTVLKAERNAASDKVQEEPLVLGSRFSRLFIVIAFCVSLIAACGLIAVYYIYSGKIKLEKEVVTLFDIPVLGEISEKKKESETAFGEELMLYCSGLENKTVFVSQLSGDAQDRLGAIKDSLDEQGIKMVIGDNVCKSPDAIKEAIACKNLIFIYQLDRTTYSDLDSLFQKCDNYGINVVGALCRK